MMCHLKPKHIREAVIVGTYYIKQKSNERGDTAYLYYLHRHYHQLHLLVCDLQNFSFSSLFFQTVLFHDLRVHSQLSSFLLCL